MWIKSTFPKGSIKLILFPADSNSHVAAVHILQLVEWELPDPPVVECSHYAGVGGVELGEVELHIVPD